MIIIGIDPGLARLGYGVIRMDRSTTVPVCYGCMETSAGTRPESACWKSTPAFPPFSIAIPRMNLRWRNSFFQKILLRRSESARCGGLSSLLLSNVGSRSSEYTPNQVKQAVTGSGRADKNQVQQMITRLLHLDEVPKPDDAADALSIALCHIHVMR